MNTTSKITGIVDTTYTWDKNGNRLVSNGNNSSQVNTNPKVLTTNQQTLTYITGKANRLQTNKTYNTNNGSVTLNKTDSISIDAAGNILNDGLRTYTYDGLNRLSSVQNVGNTILTKYTYDIQNRRVSKTNTATGINNISTNYIYADTIAGLNNTQLLGEYTVNTPLDKTEYVYLGNIPIAVYKNNNILTIHADHLNTPRQLSDSTKKVVWNLPYTAFGENIPKSINNTVFNLRYPGQYYDTESKLHYNINRY